MQATIAQGSLKKFTRALTCLAKFADDACLSASSTELILSACSSAQSAFGRVTFSWAFFDRYTVVTPSNAPISQESAAEAEDLVTLGNVNLKSALSVLKNRAVQDSIERCDIMVIEGLPSEDDTPGEYVESKFVIRFHCKNGVLKTHRLSLDVPENDMGPNVPNTAPASTSRIIAGSLVVKDLLEHFGGFRKNDPSLQWEFGNSDVKVKTVVAGTNGAGIASAISVETSEFMEYVVPEVPTCMNFPWREFDATTVLAESSNIPLTIFFTSPGEPLWIEIDAPQQRSLFVISTSPSSGCSRTRAAIQSTAGATVRSSLGKRTRASEAGPSSSNMRKERPLFLSTQRTAPERNPRMPGTQGGGHSPRYSHGDNDGGPPLSQLMSADALQQIRASGLGLEDLNARELDALMEDEGEELSMDLGPPMPDMGTSRASQPLKKGRDLESSRVGETESDEPEELSGALFLPATQAPKVAMREGKAFRPLFD